MSGDSSGASLSGQLILIIVLTILNAFFAAGEMAIVSINKTSVEEKAKNGGRKAKRILQVVSEPNKFLASIQVVITLAGFLASASAAVTFTSRLNTVLGDFPGSQELSIVIITVILSFVTLVLGELYPKRIALQRPYETLSFTEPIIRFFDMIFRPLNWLLNACNELLLKVTPIDFNEAKEPVSRDEMVATLRNSRNDGTINPDEYQMLQGIIRFGDKTAREIMVPRTDAFMLDINDSVDENIDAILSQPYSRIPVYGGDKDNVIGIIHIKDLLKKSREIGFENINLKQLMKEPLFVPEATNIDGLLLKMRSTQTQIAMVVDEYGGIVGLATIEDILEEIVGEIDDEYDPVTKNFQRLGANKFSVVGLMTIEDFDELFDEEIHVEDVDTIAGYLIMNIGEIPDAKHPQSFKLDDGVVITSGELSGSRIENVIVTVPDDKIKNVTTNMYKEKY